MKGIIPIKSKTFKSRVLSLLLAVCTLFMVPAQAAETNLIDINGTEWYAKEVVEMVNSGVITGLPDKTFGASQTISGAEFVTIVARAVGTPTGAADGHWAGLTMKSAKEAGWFTDAEISFDTYELPASRQQVAMILVNAFEGKLSKVTSITPVITDKSLILERFATYVESAYQYGLFTGDDKRNFNPFGALSRAEAAVLIYRATKNAETPADSANDIYEMVKSSGLLSSEDGIIYTPTDKNIKGVEVMKSPMGGGILIELREVYGGYYSNSRALVKQLLKLAYPTSCDEAYMLVISTILDRVFEKRNRGMNGAGAIRYLDSRKLSTGLISFGDMSTCIFIGDYNDYDDHAFNAQASPAFTGYSRRGFSKEESERISAEMIVKYGITKEEMGKE